MLPVLGQRGLWLAAQNPAWSYATAHDQALGSEQIEELWQTGKRDARLALLQRLRADAPPRARELLASTWQQEAAKERATFLQVLQTNLSMQDEPWLETVLDDRSSNVRGIAADLLARLPESRLVQRMIERVQPLLTFHKGSMLKKGHIEVTLPEECTKAMQRDGIEPKPPNKKQGEKSWWLQQMLGMIPPSFWCQQWDITPEGLVRMTRKGEWKDTLKTGCKQASLRHLDEAWARAWLAIYPSMTHEFIVMLPPEEGEKRILRILTTDSFQQADFLIEHYPHPWSIELSRAVVQAVRRSLAARKENRRTAFRLQELLLTIIPYRIVPTVAQEATAAWKKGEGENWIMHENYLREPLAILQFRHDMLEALQETQAR
jgi:hypothetical protein